MNRLYIVLGVLVMILVSCQNETTELSSAEERIAAREAAIIELLTEPTNGWKINYQPNNASGSFLILMQFDEDRTVRIQSDVADNNGEFFDHEVTYRLDHELSTELVLETYGVFHYLFERNQNSFGAEFEFQYVGEDDGNLVFTSKTDTDGSNTVLTFEPAQSFDQDLLSTTIFDQLSAGSYRQGELAGIPASVLYQIYLPTDEVSVFASLDLTSRRILFHGAKAGKTAEELEGDGASVAINTVLDIGFESEKIVFEAPVSFTLSGKSYSFSGIQTSNFAQADSVYCGDIATPTASFDAVLTGYGQAEMSSSLYTSASSFFEGESQFYLINAAFLYDDANESLFDSLEVDFPGLTYFLLIYNSTPRGYEDGTFTGLGFLSLDESDRLQWYLREMDVVQQSGNMLELSMTDGTFINVGDSLQQRNALFDYTDLIFEGNTIYATEVQAYDGLFEIYNPCNGYKFFLNE